jgi:AsmA protein
VKTLDAEIGLLSLLFGRGGVKRLVLTQPWLDLRVDAQGRRSWDLALATPSRTQIPQWCNDWCTHLVPVAAPGRQDWRPSADDLDLEAMLQRVGAIDVRIVNGAGNYVDERSGLRQEATAVNMDLALGENGGPLRVNGSFVWQREKAAIEANLSSLRSLSQHRTTRLVAKLAAKDLLANYDGVVTGQMALDGNVSLRASSTSSSRPPVGGRRAAGLVLTSSITGRDGQIVLTNFEATLRGSALGGTLVIESKATKPYLSGSLTASQLDLSELLTQPGGNEPGPDSRPRVSAPQGAGEPQGSSGRVGWSDDLLDFAPLRYADGDLTVVADRLLYDDVKTGQVRLSLQIKEGIAKVALEEMSLYEGHGHGVLTLDGRGQTPSIAASLWLNDISAKPVLKDALGLNLLDGQSTISIVVTGQGISERQIVGTLDGKVEITTTNGNIDTIDVGKILRGIEQGQFADLQTLIGEKTPFSELAGTFNIANGVTENRDLRLVSPNLRLTGAGSLNLPARTLDFTLRPKLAPSGSPEKTVINLSNVEVPLRIEGSWEQPTVSLSGQDQISETIRQIAKGIKPQDVEEVLKGLLGGGDGKSVKPRDVLEKLFGR